MLLLLLCYNSSLVFNNVDLVNFFPLNLLNLPVFCDLLTLDRMNILFCINLVTGIHSC